ncbi:hypothetical protein O181_031790, partial [Austropuccinia psidii MF-1]|nr:hypothetical protein [Austropuccinia psidii MF-1]
PELSIFETTHSTAHPTNGMLSSLYRLLILWTLAISNGLRGVIEDVTLCLNNSSFLSQSSFRGRHEKEVAFVKQRPISRRQLGNDDKTVTMTVTFTVFSKVSPTIFPQTTIPPLTSSLNLVPTLLPTLGGPAAPRNPTSAPSIVKSLETPTNTANAATSRPSLPTPSFPMTSSRDLFSSVLQAAAPTATTTPLLQILTSSFSFTNSPSLTVQFPLTTLSAPTASISPNFSTSNVAAFGETLSPSESRKVANLNRLRIPLIILSITCALALVFAALSYIYPKLRNTRAQRFSPKEAILDDYSTTARTFAPLGSGELDYQRSLSRKKNRNAALIERLRGEYNSPVVGRQSFVGKLWLPQTSHNKPFS